MSFTRQARFALAGLSAMGVAALTSNAWAVDCNTLTNPVLRDGVERRRTLHDRTGVRALSHGHDDHLPAAGSCVGVNALVKNVAISGTAKYYPSVDDGGSRRSRRLQPSG